MWWIISLVGVIILAVQIYRLATGGIAVYGFYPIVYILVALGVVYFGWSMRPAPVAAPLAPMTAGRRRRGGRW